MFSNLDSIEMEQRSFQFVLYLWRNSNTTMAMSAPHKADTSRWLYMRDNQRNNVANKEARVKFTAMLM